MSLTFHGSQSNSQINQNLTVTERISISISDNQYSAEQQQITVQKSVHPGCVLTGCKTSKFKSKIPNHLNKQNGIDTTVKFRIVCHLCILTPNDLSRLGHQS